LLEKRRKGMSSCVEGAYSWGVTVGGEVASQPCLKSDHPEMKVEYLCQDQVIIPLPSLDHMEMKMEYLCQGQVIVSLPSLGYRYKVANFIVASLQSC
jgi:hypothetical protein